MIFSAREYHDRTSYHRAAMAGGYLDWSNQPDVYKRYPGARTTPLPRETSLPQWSLRELLGMPASRGVPREVDLDALSRLIQLTCSITARARYSGGEFYYRSTPSAGALYPCELYLWASRVGGLTPGLYHYSLLEHGLVKLRSPGQNSITNPAPVLFFITAIFFRSAWKYRDRAYRYNLLDAGHLLENLVLALRALGLPYRVHYDFQDEEVNSLLGLHEEREACLVVVEVAAEAKGPMVLPALSEPVPWADTVAPRERPFPLILAAHRITYGSRSCREQAPDMTRVLGPSLGEGILTGALGSWPPSLSYVEALFARRSKRAYVPKPLDRERFLAVVESLRLQDQGKDLVSPGDALALGLLVGRVEGLEPGFYLLDGTLETTSYVARGDLLRPMARACLEQDWMAQAATHFLFLTNLEVLEAAFGPRGYRYAMLTAGRMGQRIYLTSTALGVGACGVGAFYDQEAASILGLNRESRLLYLLTVGRVRGCGQQS